MEWSKELFYVSRSESLILRYGFKWTIGACNPIILVISEQQWNSVSIDCWNRSPKHWILVLTSPEISQMTLNCSPPSLSLWSPMWKTKGCTNPGVSSSLSTLSRQPCLRDDWQQQEVPKWPWVTESSFWNRSCLLAHARWAPGKLGSFSRPTGSSRMEPAEQSQAAGMKCEFCAHASLHPYWELNTQQFSHSWPWEEIPSCSLLVSKVCSHLRFRKNIKKSRLKAERQTPPPSCFFSFVLCPQQGWGPSWSRQPMLHQTQPSVWCQWGLCMRNSSLIPTPQA